MTVFRKKFFNFSGEKECAYPDVDVGINGKDIGNFAAECQTSLKVGISSREVVMSPL